MALKDRVKQLEFDVYRLRKNSIVQTYDFGPVDLTWCVRELAAHLKKDVEPAYRDGATAALAPDFAQDEYESIRSTLNAHLALLVERAKGNLDDHDLAEISKRITDTARLLLDADRR